jgi:hypothetical protein
MGNKILKPACSRYPDMRYRKMSALVIKLVELSKFHRELMDRMLATAPCAKGWSASAPSYTRRNRGTEAHHPANIRHLKVCSAGLA